MNSARATLVFIGYVVFFYSSVEGIPTWTRSPGEISKSKCEEYSRATYTISKDNEKIFDCDLESDSSDSILASRKQFPHMVRIGFEHKGEIVYKCAGNLISENFVLTVSHCLSPPALGPPVKVKLGVTDVDDTEHAQEINIAKIFKHPDYEVMYNDIALLKLERPIEPNTYVRPACLETEKHITYQEALVSGWGVSEKGGNMSKSLTKGVVNFVSNEECNKHYETAKLKNGIDDESMVCAAIKKGKDTCQGDSGVPLQVRVKDPEDLKCMFSLVGLTSFGKACGNPNSPSVYTKVSHYIKWIEDTAWPLN